MRKEGKWTSSANGRVEKNPQEKTLKKVFRRASPSNLIVILAL